MNHLIQEITGKILLPKDVYFTGEFREPKHLECFLDPVYLDEYLGRIERGIEPGMVSYDYIKVRWKLTEPPGLVFIIKVDGFTPTSNNKFLSKGDNSIKR